MYDIDYTQEAINDLKRLKQNEPKAYQKARRFIEELAEHPKTGLGHPEPLKGKPEGRWSREITKSTGWSIGFLKLRYWCLSFLPTDITTISKPSLPP